MTSISAWSATRWRRPRTDTIAGLGPLEDLVDVRGGAPPQLGTARSIRQEPARLCEFPEGEHRRQPVLGREAHDASSLRLVLRKRVPDANLGVPHARLF